MQLVITQSKEEHTPDQQQLPPRVCFRSLETQVSKLQALNFYLCLLYEILLVFCPGPGYRGCCLLMAHLHLFLGTALSPQATSLRDAWEVMLPLPLSPLPLQPKAISF